MDVHQPGSFCHTIGDISLPVMQMLVLVAAVIFSMTNIGFAQTARIEISDIAHLIDLSSPQISPDGKNIALIVSRPNLTDNRHDNELVLVEIPTRAMRVLTYERPRIHHPRWSPTGDRLAFLDAREGEKTQLFVMSMAGGEAKCITHAARDISLFTWRPDGKKLAYVVEDDPQASANEEKFNKSFEVGNNDYLATAAPMPSHIWLITAEGDTCRRLTSGTAGVLKNYLDTIAWSPDGKRIVFSSQPQPHAGEIAQGSLKTVEIETGALRTIDAGPILAQGPSFSPNGLLLAYSRSSGGKPFWYPHNILITPTSGGKRLYVTNAIDRTFYGAAWAPDGGAVVVCGDDFTARSIWLQPLNGIPHRLNLGSAHPSEFTVGRDGSLAFLGSESQHPTELYYKASFEAPPKRLTEFNQHLASLSLGQVESIAWQGPDDFEEDGVLVYPPNFDKNKKYPLVLVIHGGPMNTSTEAFDPLAQLLAARNWIVFSPNYRGSSNRGSKYLSAIVNDAGDGAGRDIMAGLDALKKRGFVDTDRIAVSGWSYGGYMTTWLISHYQGWRAAVAGAAVTDYSDSYYLSDLNVVFGTAFHQPPWSVEGARIWREQSPFTYATKIKTPTLLLATTGDLRVPITQSYKLYHALKENGVPVKFIAYPLSGHHVRDPVHRLDVYQRWLEWIEQHFEESYLSPKQTIP